MAAIAAMGLATSSCSNEMEEPMGVQTRAVLASQAGMDFDAAQIAGYGAKEFNFVSGRNETKVGSIQVWNDDTNLYVKFNITNKDYAMTETHLYVGTEDEFFNGKYIKNGNIHPGQLPYKGSHQPATMEYTYTIPLTDLYAKYGLTFGEDESEVCPLIAAHAAAANGESISIQTPAPEEAQLTTRGKGNGNKDKNKGNGNSNGGGNWFMYVNGDYCVEFPDETPEEPDEDKTYTWSFSEEGTACVADENNKLEFTGGNWFTYIKYKDQTSPYTAKIYTGRDQKEIGTATITDADGDQVTITLNLHEFDPEAPTMEDDNEWVLKHTANDCIKIAGYDTDPNELGVGHNWGKEQKKYQLYSSSEDGIETTITVAKKDYYYIHLDVAKLSITEVTPEE